jgi:hypothetical protein
MFTYIKTELKVQNKQHNIYSLLDFEKNLVVSKCLMDLINKLKK